MEIDLGTEGWVESDVEDEEQYVSGGTPSAKAQRRGM